MTGSDIITQFELQVDDATELSSAEELIIANRVARKVYNEKPWEFLKKQASGTTSTDSTSAYIDAPSDFLYFASNANYTGNNLPDIVGTSDPKVIFIGPNYEPYVIINFSDRRQYRNQNGYAYFDAVNNKIRFTATPSSTTYEFDYIYNPDDFTTSTSPVLPAPFHEIIVYGMAVEDTILQRSPKATSYAQENQSRYTQYLQDLAYYNSNLILD